MLLRSWRFRNKPVAFWRIGADTVDVAVIRSATGEPLLLACAGLDGHTVGKRAAHGGGLFELSMAVQSRSLVHVAALGDEFCRVLDPGGHDGDGGQTAKVETSGADPDCGPERLRLSIANDDNLLCDADAAAASAVATSFRVLGLSLAAIDCAPCAERNLAAFLGEQLAVVSEVGGSGGADVSRLDPLAAVSVAPEIEEEALGMGPRLAVPVGLALGHLGWMADA